MSPRHVLPPLTSAASSAAQVQQEKASTAKQGFRMGGRQLADGFLSGAAGIVQQPVRGAMSGGAGGFVNGLGRGLVGAVTKPVAGIAGFTSKWTEGLASDAKKLTPDAMKAAQQTRVLRVRQPRRIAIDGVMRTYARTPPLLIEGGLQPSDRIVEEAEEEAVEELN